MYNVCHISPQIVMIKDVKPKEKEMGLRHRLTIWMFVDIPEKLLCCLSVHIIKGFYLVRITFLNTFFSDMILEMEPIDVHPRSFAQLLRHLVFLLLFLHSQLIFQYGSCHCKGCTLMLSMSIIRQVSHPGRSHLWTLVHLSWKDLASSSFRSITASSMLPLTLCQPLMTYLWPYSRKA